MKLRKREKNQKELISIDVHPQNEKGYKKHSRKIKKEEFKVSGVKGKVVTEIPPPPQLPDSLKSKDVIETGASLALMPDSSEEFFNRPVNHILDHPASTIEREAGTSRGISMKSAAFLTGIGLVAAAIINRNDKKKYRKKFLKWRKSAKFAVQPTDMNVDYLGEPLYRQLTNSKESAFIRADSPNELKPNIFNALWELEPDSDITVGVKKEMRELLRCMDLEEGDKIEFDLIVSEGKEGGHYIKNVEKLEAGWTDFPSLGPEADEREREFLLELPSNPNVEMKQYLEEGWISVDEYETATQRTAG